MSDKIYQFYGKEGLTSIRIPRVIARISLCGAFTLNVADDNRDWVPPTSEQIKNLKEVFNIDVKLVKE